VAFAAIQGLNAEMNERTMKLQAENDALRRQVAAQKAQFDALEARLKKLEQAAPVRRKTKRRWDDELNGGGDTLLFSKHWSREARSCIFFCGIFRPRKGA
jgi:predicted nuclease with TOPRIM domain